MKFPRSFLTCQRKTLTTSADVALILVIIAMCRSKTYFVTSFVASAKSACLKKFFFPLAAYSRDIGLAIIKWNLLAQGRCVIERKDFTFEFGFQGRLTTPLCSQGGEELRRRLRGLGVGVRMGGTGSFPTAVLGPPGGLPRRLTNRLKASKET
jgi:hypothetical protein